jgi:rhomboid protease GluP
MEPQQSGSEPIKPSSAAPTALTFIRGSRRPVLTCALLTVFIAVYAGEVLYGIGPPAGRLPYEPSVSTLVAWGGLQYPLVVEQGQWHRLFSAPLLHGSDLHLFLNGISFFISGKLLERLVGRLWLAALFVIGGLGGGLASLVINPHNIVSVGASGSIITLVLAICILAGHFPEPLRSRVLAVGLQMLIPSLLSVPGSLKSASGIDYAAHLGGAVSGLAMGFILLRLWPRRMRWPPFRPFAATLVAIGIGGCGYAAIAGPRLYPIYASIAEFRDFLIPQAMAPTTNAASRALARELMIKYPRDPRTRLYWSLVLLDIKDFVGAERELRAALAQKDVLRILFPPEVTYDLEAMLAVALFHQKEFGKAREAARRVCNSSPYWREILKNDGLCDQEPR